MISNLAFGQLNVAIALDMKIYKGKNITHEQFNQIKQKIININQSNNDQLRLYGYNMFPDKFTMDLADLEETCKRQEQLIDLVKVRNAQKMQYLTELTESKLLHSRRQADARNQIQAKQKQINDLKRQLEKMKESSKQISEQIKKMKIRENEQIKKNNYLTQRLKIMQKKYNDECISSYNAQLRVVKEKNRGVDSKSSKTMMYVNDGKQSLKNFLQAQMNNRDKNCTQEAMKALSQYQIQNYEQRLKSLRKQNSFLKQWIETFVCSIRKILDARVKILEQRNDQKRINFINYQLMPKMNLNLSLVAENGFPYGNLLQEFQIIVMKADQNRLQKQKYEAIHRNQIVNRKCVQQIIREVRKIRSSIIAEFQKAGYKRAELARIYEDIFPLNANYNEIINETTIDRIRKFGYYTERILHQIQSQLINLIKNRPQFEKNIRDNQPYMLKVKRQLKNENEKNVRQYFNEQQRKTEQYQHLIRQRQEQLQNQKQQILMENIQTQQQKRRRQRKQRRDQAMRLVDHWIQERPMEKQFQKLKMKMRKIQTERQAERQTQNTNNFEQFSLMYNRNMKDAIQNKFPLISEFYKAKASQSNQMREQTRDKQRRRENYFTNRNNQRQIMNIKYQPLGNPNGMQHQI